MHDFVGESRRKVGNQQDPQHIQIPYVTEGGDFQEAYVKVQRHNPDEVGRVAQQVAESIVGFCSGCRMQATLTFPNGADHRDCDRALQGKPVKVLCPRCQKVQEFLPADRYFNHPMVQRNQQYIRQAAKIRPEDLR